LSQFLYKVTVTSCNFYSKCSMCPPCCWRRTLKMWCYRSRLVFSCCLKTLAFQKVVQRHTWGAMRSLAIVLFQIFSWFLQWKKVGKLVNIWRSH